MQLRDFAQQPEANELGQGLICRLNTLGFSPAFSGSNKFSVQLYQIGGGTGWCHIGHGSWLVTVI